MLGPTTAVEAQTWAPRVLQDLRVRGLKYFQTDFAQRLFSIFFVQGFFFGRITAEWVVQRRLWKSCGLLFQCPIRRCRKQCANELAIFCLMLAVLWRHIVLVEFVAKFVGLYAFIPICWNRSGSPSELLERVRELRTVFLTKADKQARVKKTDKYKSLGIQFVEEALDMVSQFMARRSGPHQAWCETHGKHCAIFPSASSELPCPAAVQHLRCELC